MIDINNVYTSNNYGDFRIVKYVNNANVEIEFIDTGYRSISQLIHINSGAVKDKLMPNIHGVGYLGDGKHKASFKGKLLKVYHVWTDMLRRCYCAKSLIKHPTYVGCTVVDEWHDFQNFAEWFNANYIYGFDLDKDIKIKGNKIYSPSACIFASRTANNIEAQAKDYIFLNPKGVKIAIYNLKSFCAEHGLEYRNMSSVHLGNRDYCHGWSKA